MTTSLMICNPRQTILG